MSKIQKYCDVYFLESENPKTFKNSKIKNFVFCKSLGNDINFRIIAQSFQSALEN